MGNTQDAISNVWQWKCSTCTAFFSSTWYHHVQLKMIALLREFSRSNLIIINVTGPQLWVCTQQLAHSVRFQAPHLLYMPLLHRYVYCYLRHISANYANISFLLIASIVWNCINTLFRKVWVNFKVKTWVQEFCTIKIPYMWACVNWRYISTHS